MFDQIRRLKAARFASRRGKARVPNDDAEKAVGGRLFFEFVSQELKNERERRAALDSRSVTVITSSGSFVTLSFALVAVVTKMTDYRPSQLTIILLALATLALCSAALFALLASRLVFYVVVTTEQLISWTRDEFWLDEEDNARWQLTHANSRTIKSLRQGNAVKANRLLYALWAQLLAFGLMSASIVVVLVEQL